MAFLVQHLVAFSICRRMLKVTGLTLYRNNDTGKHAVVFLLQFDTITKLNSAV